MDKIKAGLAGGTVVIQSKIDNALKLGHKRPKSSVWESFGQLYDQTTNRMIDNYTICLKCKALTIASGSCTTVMLRHECQKEETMCVGIEKYLNLQTSKKSTKFSSNEKSKIKMACVNFVAKDLRPFYAIEGDGLFDLLEQVMLISKSHPHMTRSDLEKLIPCANTVRSDVVKIGGQRMKDIETMIHKAIEFAGGICITTDMWTDEHRHRSYVCLTAHFYLLEDGKPCLKNFVIHMNVMEELSKTAANLKIYIENVLIKYRLDLNENVTFVHDRGSNIKSALSTYKQIFCFAHMINNLVRKMCQNDFIKTLIENSSKLVQYCKKSGLLDMIAKDGGTTLQSHCPTRFNTVEKMFHSILENYSHIVKALDAKEKADKKLTVMDKITCLNKAAMKEIRSFLHIFTKMTEEISGEKYGTMHRVWFMIEQIHKKLIFNVYDSDIVEEMKVNGRIYMHENRKEFSPTIEHKISVFLHPMMKSLKMLNPEMKEELLTYVNSMIKPQVVNVEHTSRSELNIVEDGTVEDNNDNILEAFLDDKLSESENSNRYCDELNRYIKLCLPVDSQFKTFKLEDWWFENQQIYQKLSRLFFRINCIPATSIPSERTFSTSGYIVNEKRSRLEPEAIESIFLVRNKL